MKQEMYLGIELGSTRIKAQLIDSKGNCLVSGSHTWDNRYENGVWTYSEEDVWEGLKDCYRDLKQNYQKYSGEKLTRVEAIGISAMMHGYMVFNEAGQLLVPFRTWRNNITGEAAAILSEKLDFAIPQRWSIAHLYQAILNKEAHLNDIRYMTTLEGYVHWKLTGRKVIGIGEASGMFPIDSVSKNYDPARVQAFQDLIREKHFAWSFPEIMPEILLAGDDAGVLSAEGAKMIDPDGDLEAGIPFCPPEGDADTGMVATNCLVPGDAHISAGTSVFANVVVDKPLSKPYPVIDMAVTPLGDPLAMVHSNNCTTELNAWVGLFREFSELMGMPVDNDKLYSVLYEQALKAEQDGGGLLAYGYVSGEHITGFDTGAPVFARMESSRMNLANFMRTQLMTSIAALTIGMQVLKDEHVPLTHVVCQGGLFKTPVVGQRMVAAAIGTPVSVTETAGEGGAWGMALLALYMKKKEAGLGLARFLQKEIFGGVVEKVEAPVKEEEEGYRRFLERYQKGLPIERAAVDCGAWD